MDAYGQSDKNTLLIYKIVKNILTNELFLGENQNDFWRREIRLCLAQRE